jgi:hypothetical protein
MLPALQSAGRGWPRSLTVRHWDNKEWLSCFHADLAEESTEKAQASSIAIKRLCAMLYDERWLKRAFRARAGLSFWRPLIFNADDLLAR